MYHIDILKIETTVNQIHIMMTCPKFITSHCNPKMGNWGRKLRDSNVPSSVQIRGPNLVRVQSWKADGHLVKRFLETQLDELEQSHPPFFFSVPLQPFLLSL